jgi:hypothetical protein
VGGTVSRGRKTLSSSRRKWQHIKRQRRLAISGKGSRAGPVCPFLAPACGRGQMGRTRSSRLTSVADIRKCHSRVISARPAICQTPRRPAGRGKRSRGPRKITDFLGWLRTGPASPFLTLPLAERAGGRGRIAGQANSPEERFPFVPLGLVRSPGSRQHPRVIPAKTAICQTPPAFGRFGEGISGGTRLPVHCSGRAGEGKWGGPG